MTNTPKIYGWLNSHLSIARYCGRVKINGVGYTVDMTDPDMPLIRAGVRTFAKEQKAKRASENKIQASFQTELI